MDPHHAHPRVNGAPEFFRAPAKIVKEQWLKFGPAFPRLLLKGIVHQVRGISSKVCEKVSRAILRCGSPRPPGAGRAGKRSRR